MIKYNWEINDNERERILSLHENATKKHYLIKEQNDDENKEPIGDNNFPKNIRFKYNFNDFEGFPLKQRAYSYDCETNDKGEVFINLGEDYGKQKLPEVTEVNLPKFWYFDDDGKIMGTDEWDWINVINNQLLLPGEGTLNYVIIPSYSRTNASKQLLRYWFWYPKKVKNLTESTDFLQANDKKYIYYNENYIKVAGESWISGGRIGPSGYTPPPPPKPPKEETYKFDLSAPFTFDDVKLTPEAEAKFNELINYIKNNYQGVTGNVEVLASSSIDQNPNEVIVGKYSECSSNDKNHTRHDYNFCLSQKRAEYIVNQIKEKTGNNSLNFVAKGIGETEQFDPGKKWPEVTDNTKTAQNRRLIISLPQITKKVE